MKNVELTLTRNQTLQDQISRDNTESGSAQFAVFRGLFSFDPSSQHRFEDQITIAKIRTGVVAGVLSAASVTFATKGFGASLLRNASYGAIIGAGVGAFSAFGTVAMQGVAVPLCDAGTSPESHAERLKQRRNNSALLMR